MCTAKAPSYKAPPSYARAKEPDNAALYEEAQSRAAMRGGGTKRNTLLTGLSGTTTPPTLGRAGTQQQRTVLG